VLPEERVQVKPDRFRIPDVCVVLGAKPKEPILTKPPLICIEILSPEDRMSRVAERVDDYLSMGVPHIWVLDPVKQRCWTVTPADGWREVKTGLLTTERPSIEVPLAEIFADQ
jgi:Uma2 family endonuclease